MNGTWLWRIKNGGFKGDHLRFWSLNLLIVIFVSEPIGQPTCSVLVYAWILKPQSQV